jgi:hypothetical protein
MRANFDFEELVKYSFSSYEQSTFRTLPEAAKHQAFFTAGRAKKLTLKQREKAFPFHLTFLMFR